MRCLLCGLFSILALRPLGAETLTYRETVGGKTQTHRYVLTPRPEGFEIELTRGAGTAEIVDWCQTDETLATLRWRHENPREKTAVAAERTGDSIRLSGVHAGREIAREFRIDGAPWKQLFSVDFASFIDLGTTRGRFWSIGTAGIGEMKIASFTVELKEGRGISVGGKPVQAVRLHVSPAGLRSAFWHGDYWLRKPDGRYLKYVGKVGLFAGDLVKELVTEE